MTEVYKIGGMLAGFLICILLSWSDDWSFLSGWMIGMYIFICTLWIFAGLRLP
jgi:hypothetical protein